MLTSEGVFLWSCYSLGTRQPPEQPWVCVTAKRKGRRKAKEKTRKETRKEGEHLD